MNSCLVYRKWWLYFSLIIILKASYCLNTVSSLQKLLKPGSLNAATSMVNVIISTMLWIQVHIVHPKIQRRWYFLENVKKPSTNAIQMSIALLLIKRAVLIPFTFPPITSGCTVCGQRGEIAALNVSFWTIHSTA